MTRILMTCKKTTLILAVHKTLATKATSEIVQPVVTSKLIYNSNNFDRKSLEARAMPFCSIAGDRPSNRRYRRRSSPSKMTPMLINFYLSATSMLPCVK